MIAINKLFNKKINEKLLLIAIFVIPLVVFLWRLEDNYMILLSDDEFCQWANAAWLNGEDWSKICGQKGYYSYFYSFFLAIIYRCFDSSAQMYQAAVVFNSLLLAGTAIIAYHICKKIDTKERPVLWAMVGIACSLCSANIVYSNLTWTESFLTFITWIIFWLAFDIAEDSSKWHLLKTVIFIVLLMFGYMTHQRFLGVLIAGGIFVLCNEVQRGMDIKKIGIPVLAFLAIALVHRFIKNGIQNELYQVAERGYIGNDYSSVIIKIKNMLSLEGITRTLQVLCGHIFYEGVASILIGFLGLYEIIRRFFVALKEKASKQAILCLFLFCAIGFSVAVSAVFMNNPSRIDQVIYGRYAENTYGILLLLGIMRISTEELNDREFWIPSLILVTLAILMNPLISLLDYKGNIFQHFCAPGISYYWYKGHDFLQTSLIVICMYAIVFIFSMLLRKLQLKNGKGILATLTIALVVVVGIVNGTGINNDIVIPLKQQYAGDYEALYGKDGYIGQDKELVYLYFDENSEPFVHDSPGENAMWFSFLKFCLKDKMFSLQEVGVDNLDGLANADYIVGAIHNEYLDKFDFEYGGNKFIHLTESEPDGESKLNLDMFYTSGSRQADGLVSNGSENQALMFGPYIKIEKGNYVVQLSIEADSTDAIRIQTDISGNKGLSIFAGYAVSDQDFTDGKAEVVIPFTLEEDCTDFEIRVFTDNVIKVTGVSLAEQ